MNEQVGATASQSPVDCEWHDTGFGGYCGYSWQRLAAAVRCSKNGTQLQIWVRFPGDTEPRILSFRADDLVALAGETHGTIRRLRTDTDARMEVAIAELGVEVPSLPEGFVEEIAAALQDSATAEATP